MQVTELSKYEQEALLKNPIVLQQLSWLHTCWECEADAIGEPFIECARNNAAMAKTYMEMARIEYNKDPDCWPDLKLD